LSDPVCWGLFRETAHSPGREKDDAEILRLTAAALEDEGFEVRLRAADDAEDMFEAERPLVFLMCERPEIVARLRVVEANGGTLVNAPSAVRNTDRERMLELFRANGVRFPESRVVPTTRPPKPAESPVWVKRFNFHATQPEDVVFVAAGAPPDDALGAMAARGLPRAVIQRHVDGDLLKFYGVGNRPEACNVAPWFTSFYHKDQDLKHHRFDAGALATAARAAAAALGIEVFGGDAIVGPDGVTWIIDLNAWPSFALYRDEAAGQIAAYLAARFREERATSA